MKKLTAVEQLISDLNKNGFLGFYCDKSLEDQKRTLAFQLIDKANKLFKEHIVDAFDKGNPAGFVDKDGEQYYSETFNQVKS